MAALPGHIGLAFDTGASWTRAQYATEGSNPELADIVLDKSCSATLSQGPRQVLFLLCHARLSLALDRHLCRGMRMLQDASCAQLSNTSYLQEVIQTTGVTYDPRKRDLYGDAAQYMIKTSTGQKIGLTLSLTLTLTLILTLTLTEP